MWSQKYSGATPNVLCSSLCVWYIIAPSCFWPHNARQHVYIIKASRVAGNDNASWYVSWAHFLYDFERGKYSKKSKLRGIVFKIHANFPRKETVSLFRLPTLIIRAHYFRCILIAFNMSSMASGRLNGHCNLPVKEIHWSISSCILCLFTENICSIKQCVKHVNCGQSKKIWKIEAGIFKSR